MADYYPLLARALDAMPDRSPALRNAVYERARGALVAQLRTLDPPIPESDIELERRALNAAIARLEADYDTPPVPEDAQYRSEPAPLPPVEPLTPSAVEPALAPPPFHEEPTPPARPEPAIFPPAPPLDFAPSEPAPPRDVVSFAAPSRPAKAEEANPVAAEAGNATTVETDRLEVAPGDAIVLGTPEPEPGTVRQRPRLDVVAPRTGRSRLLRNVFVGAVLALVIGLIAVAAFLLRDKPSDLASGVQDTQDSAGDTADSKFSERVGGERVEPERRPPIPATATPTAPVVGQGEVTVAQRAHLLEENTADPKAEPAMVPGRVVWRLDVVNGEQGQPLQTVVRATIDVPDANMSLAMTIRKNTDATLPASHTVELAFTTTGAEAAKRSVENIGLLALKDNEQGRGSNVSGLPVRVRENLFLIGLSSLKGDVDRNTDLLLHRPWFDLALKYVSGPRAILTFEKGNVGDQVLKNAFDAWRD